MRLKALKSFVGQVTMTIDEVKEVTDEKLAHALINAGMAIEAEAKKAEAKVVDKKEEKKKKGKVKEEPTKNEEPVEVTDEEEPTEPVEE